ncbi:MAG TPA: hypothetical protein DEO65_04455 [Bacillus bacterium]|uniref:hypothetical protein n=1 Tax=Siminovitchia fordii TaxID=254759 RepID=UPI00036BAD7D|nr:hypothetical protein [Siminovitchia fordii]HBZ09127.1 hypothetical protein [Bacillus sp. (in: firmicutes)]
MHEEGLDNIPDWPEMMKQGMSFDEYMKFRKQKNIERMEYMLKVNEINLSAEEKAAVIKEIEKEKRDLEQST